jgi:hypothetical protein
MEKARYRYRASPQLSANQMAEYLSSSATSTRRRGIIREARFPKTSQVAQYDRAREGLVNFLDDGTRSFRHLAGATEALERREIRPDATNWIKRDSRFSIEAIDAFQRSYNKLIFPKLDCRAVRGSQPVLDMFPTKIGVTLDFTIHRPTKGGRDQIGAAIFLFSRGETSSKSRVERSKTTAGLIFTHVSRFLGGLGDPDPTICLAVDVFGGVAHTPPGTFSRKLRNVADACEEIAGQWKTVSPPTDYDGPTPS